MESSLCGLRGDGDIFLASSSFNFDGGLPRARSLGSDRQVPLVRLYGKSCDGPGRNCVNERVPSRYDWNLSTAGCCVANRWKSSVDWPSTRAHTANDLVDAGNLTIQFHELGRFF